MKLKVAIIGTGNIGTDLLVKIMRSEYLTCTLFTGRTLDSVGMKRAKKMNIPISDKGIRAIVENPDVCDVVVDCTSAQSHIEHWKILEDLGKTVIDMTPAKLGETCVPALDIQNWLPGCVYNVNMITCGGQTTVPIAFALSKVHKNIEYIEVVSSIASLSAGPATRQNLDEYVNTTEEALRTFSGAKNSKAILILNPASPPIDMVTTIYAKIANPNLARITESVNNMIEKIRQYVPGYQLLIPPVVKDNTVMITVKVLGAGDHLPQYAGNLDIINCAAIRVLEIISQSRK
jgi:acetaldehyde dehydrogenase (acetylating)